MPNIKNARCNDRVPVPLSPITKIFPVNAHVPIRGIEDRFLNGFSIEHIPFNTPFRSYRAWRTTGNLAAIVLASWRAKPNAENTADDGSRSPTPNLVRLLLDQIAIVDDARSNPIGIVIREESQIAHRVLDTEVRKFD